MNRVLICGDLHKDCTSIKYFCNYYKSLNFSRDDTMILLGDSAINWYLDGRDDSLKIELSQIPLTFFVLRGNHDARILDTIEKRTNNFEDKDKYLFRRIFGDWVYIEREYPNIIFANDCPSIFHIGSHRVLTLPGAYSVDAPMRKARGAIWYENEQMDAEDMKIAEKLIENYQPDVILSHTAPASLVPTDLFLRSIDQSKVDHTMENFFDTIYKTADYKLWCWGHYHKFRDYGVDNGKHHIMFDGDNIVELEDALKNPNTYERYDMSY